MHRFGRPRRAPLCSATARCRVEACALRLRCSCALRAAGRFRFRRSERAAERQGRGSKRAPDLRQSRRAAGNRCPEPSTLRNLLRAEVGPKHASWDRILRTHWHWLKSVRRATRVAKLLAHRSTHIRAPSAASKGLLVPLGQQTILKRGARAAARHAVAAATHTKPWPCCCFRGGAAGHC